MEKPKRNFSPSVLEKLQERASNYRHSDEVRERMSCAKRMHSPETIVDLYRQNDYNAVKTDRMLSRSRGYTYSYLRRLYVRKPELKVQLQNERKQAKKTHAE